MILKAGSLMRLKDIWHDISVITLEDHHEENCSPRKRIKVLVVDSNMKAWVVGSLESIRCDRIAEWIKDG